MEEEPSAEDEVQTTKGRKYEIPMRRSKGVREEDKTPEYVAPPAYDPPIPYPQRVKQLKKEQQDKQFAKFLEVFKKLQINIPFVEALTQMPSYAKFMKEILSQKRKIRDDETVLLTEECSAILQNKLPPKLKDPGSFTIPCVIGDIYFNKALCDLGASINLMPLSIFRKLGVGEVKPTMMSLQLADRSIKHPRGIIEDVLVKLDKLIFPVDFVVLDMEEDREVPLILGRPFLATRRALIDVQEGKLELRVQDEKVTFNVFDATKFPLEADSCLRVDVIEEVVTSSFGAISTTTPLEAYLVNSKMAEEFEDSNLQLCHELLEAQPVVSQPFSDTLTRDKELQPVSKEPPQLELKQLPIHLRYAFLGEGDTYPVIISASLSSIEEEKLLRVLRDHRTAIGWQISDLRGISPTFCMHKIFMEDDFKPLVQPQRRLNPTMKEVVKKEVVKLLDAGIIYPISDSVWVSPVQVVPKKGGITVVKNENNELIPTRTVTGWRMCIDYRKLNDATRKDHFPLPFMD